MFDAELGPLKKLKVLLCLEVLSSFLFFRVFINPGTQMDMFNLVKNLNTMQKVK